MLKIKSIFFWHPFLLAICLYLLTAECFFRIRTCLKKPSLNICRKKKASNISKQWTFSGKSDNNGLLRSPVAFSLFFFQNCQTFVCLLHCIPSSLSLMEKCKSLPSIRKMSHFPEIARDSTMGTQLIGSVDKDWQYLQREQSQFFRTKI